jgi:hypothetical protein
MSWDEKLDKIQKFVDLAIRADIHAILMVGLGALMCLHGNKDEGQLVIGAGLAVFKGNK